MGLASSGCATQIPHDSKLGAFGIVWGPVIGVFKAETTASFTNPFAALRARREGLALDVIRAVADNARLDGSLTSDLAEAELADFFIWTYKRLPPPSDDRKSGFRWVGPNERIDHLRNAALRRLVSLGTTAALSAVQRIATELPEAPWLKYQVLDARRALDANNWKLRDLAANSTDRRKLSTAQGVAFAALNCCSTPHAF